MKLFDAVVAIDPISLIRAHHAIAMVYAFSRAIDFNSGTDVASLCVYMSV